MKGTQAVLARLNELLADELTAINQYMVHSEMCANWGYDRLHKAIESRAIQEMKHAETLIARILFLEGVPIVGTLNKIYIGADVEAQLRNDISGEVNASKMYNAGVQICVQEGDNGSREILEDILKDEESHADWLEAQLDQIAQMGLANYLTRQVE